MKVLASVLTTLVLSTPVINADPQKRLRREVQQVVVYSDVTGDFITKKDDKLDKKDSSSKSSKSSKSSGGKFQSDSLTVVTEQTVDGPFTVYDFDCNIIQENFFFPGKPGAGGGGGGKKVAGGSSSKSGKGKGKGSSSSRRRRAQATTPPTFPPEGTYAPSDAAIMNDLVNRIFGDSSQSPDENAALLRDIIEAQAELCNPVVEQATSAPSKAPMPPDCGGDGQPACPCGVPGWPACPTTAPTTPVREESVPPPSTLTTPVPPPQQAPTLSGPLPTMSPYLPPQDGPSTPVAAQVVPPSPGNQLPQEPLTQCEEAYVYCPGRSSCFNDPQFNGNNPITSEGEWGYNIHYNADEDASIGDCQIWVKVQGCDFSTGRQVGTATITEELFHFCLDLNDYESNEFQLYAGKCVANDAGAQLTNGGICDTNKIATSATDEETYTMVHSGGPKTSTFTFDRSDPVNSQFWGSYNPFPIGTSGNNYLIGKVWVCPKGFEEQATAEPLPSPVAIPAPVPVPIPPPVTPATQAPFPAPVPPPFTPATQAPFPAPVPPPFTPATQAPFPAPVPQPITPATQAPFPAPVPPPITPATQAPFPAPVPPPITPATQAPFPAPVPAPVTPPTPYPTMTNAIPESLSPTPLPTPRPTAAPTPRPTVAPTPRPTPAPTMSPTPIPTTASPTPLPTVAETLAPTPRPTNAPTPKPSSAPTPFPTPRPTGSPVTASPTPRPTRQPTPRPTGSPVTASPTPRPTTRPTPSPTTAPTPFPTKAPTPSPVTAAPTRKPTASPTKSPTSLPSIAETIPPSPSPTLSPTTAVPTTKPTPSPTKAPTPSPTMPPTTKAPTPMPTKSPTSKPTSEPTVIFQAESETCSAGWVYCPGRSTCFTELVDNPDQDMWGWSISYDASEGTVDNCFIYIGGKFGCNLEEATLVGKFTLTPDLAHYCLDIGEYESNAFHLYAGKCLVNDAGKHLASDDECTSTAMSKYGDMFNTFTLVSEGGPYVDSFTFDKEDPVSTMWGSDYKAFPVGGPSRNYISAHVDVCPVSGTAAPVPPTIDSGSVAPVPSPVMVPVPAPVMAPTTIDAPVPAPVFQAEGTSAPDGVGVEQPDDKCIDAFVYCPGRSVCLTDSSFNNGNPSTSLGWSIEYNPSTDGVITDCLIYMGAVDNCDLSAATEVGTFTITNDFVHYCMDDMGYGSDTFSYFAGCCVGNDNNSGCDSESISNFSSSFSTYPINIVTDKPVTSYGIDKTRPINVSGSNWEATYTIFPLDGLCSGNTYMSARTCVKPFDVASNEQSTSDSSWWIPNGGN